jgi:SNF2 family DNA or RNA helicase
LKIIASENLFAILEACADDMLTARDRCGFRFDPVTRMLVGVAANVESLRNHKLLMKEKIRLTQTAAVMFEAAGFAKRTAVEMSHAKDSSVVIPVPEGLSYLPFQRAGIEYASQRPLVLIADEMGLGKTVQAIGTVNADPNARRILIVCPASLKRNWRREWMKWDVKGLQVQIVDGTTPQEFTGNVLILNYEILKAHRTQIKETGNWDVMIVDECHALKTAKTQRTLEVFGGKLYERENRRKVKEEFFPIPANKKILLSGTPIVNKPKELWPLLQTLDPGGIGAKANWHNYAQRYCKLLDLGKKTDPWGNEYTLWQWDGADNLDELQDILRERFMVRRLKKDVLTELPAKRRQIVILEPDTVTLTKLIAREAQAYADYEPDSFLGKPQPSIGEISVTRKKIALLKVKFAVEHIKELLNETEKLVVFGHHHSTLDALQEAFGESSVRIDGRVSLDDRQKAVDRFQTDPSCRVFIGGIQAAGVGLTLTAASTVVFVESSWVPGENSQAEDRCHRIGQRESVLVQHLILEGSLDERVVGVVIAKQEIIDAALDKPEPSA